ncbi:MAG: DUF58 domain-containing protein [Myxococcota bacterium]|nr:DUF58 domain-containing protein [Myxococcota bacterium]
MAKEKKRRRRGPPRRLKFTREGRVFVFVTVGVGAAAVNTGNNLLYLVLGLLLSLIVLSGILSELVLRSVRVGRQLPRRAFAGTPCLVELSLLNLKRRLPSYSVELEDVAGPDDEGGRRVWFLKVGPGETQLRAYSRTPARRGWLRLTQLRVRTRYPFGLFEKWRVIDVEDALLVFPKVDDAPSIAQVRAETGPDAPSRRLGPGAEVAGLRDYVAGDDARSIHWRRSASLGRVVVRERQRDEARKLTLVVDEGRPADASEGWDEAFEALVSRTARRAADALERGAAVEIVSRSGTSPLVLAGQPPDPLWRHLALLEIVPLEDGAEALAVRGEVTAA